MLSFWKTKKKLVISRQLLRAATGIGANVRETQNAESKADFIHKMKIGAKEADETNYWLMLCDASENYSKPGTLIENAESIIRVLSKIISSSKATRVNS